MSITTQTATEELVPLLESMGDYLDIGVEYDASDIHITPSCKPTWRLHGVLGPIWENSNPLTANDTEKLVFDFLPEEEKALLINRGDVDFAYETSKARFRASVVKQRLGYEAVFRVINTQIKTMEELNLPIKVLKPLTEFHNGLILVTGSVGSGKSTTLAAMINEINETRSDHIITVEDPIEFVHPSKMCHVNQREIPRHSKSFASALKAALREDPDVMLVGEMRDLETISLAITAAETGHLVLGTLHTGSAARTLDRVLDVFPIDQREQIRVMVGGSMRGVISQQLMRKKDGTGRCLAMEILVNTPAVANSIREGKTFMLPGIMQTGKSVGMITMDDSLKNLYGKGLISSEDFISASSDKVEAKKVVK